jgi:hypothetical protein
MAIVRHEDLDPAAFLELIKTDPTAIKSAHIKPPRLGDGTFGKIWVVYRVPRVRHRV